MTEAVYHRLVSSDVSGEHIDRHTLACVIAVVRGDPAQTPAVPMTHALGLAPDALASLFASYFPDALDMLPWMAEDEGEGEMALEEDDLRRLLLAHRAGQRPEEEAWLANIVARRSIVGPNHLWQDLGLRDRADLSALMGRYFPGLVALNSDDMKWKKFFYRTLCQQEGVVICKSPNCTVCDDYAHCFSEEAGTSILFSQPADSVAPPPARR
ncbi:MAG: hydrogenase [Rhodospirillaceae bacterium BRH_c57]|nr:MAG: hydrogenase [Rhodospirillaceae bacterium BRH_c57]